MPLRPTVLRLANLRLANFGGPLLLTASVLAAGCSLSPLAKRTAAFSTAATAAATDSTNGYQAVEDIFYQAQVSALVISFDTQGFDRTSIQPFIPAPDMRVRTDILNGLHDYAELLADVSGDKPIDALDKSTSALGSSLQAFSKDDLKSFASAQDINIAVTALNALGGILIEHKRSRELPGILDRMKEPIQTICTLLQKDIGDTQKSGLRNQMHNSYGDIIRKQQQFIHQNEKSMSASEKRTEIERLPKLVLASTRADRILANTQQELADLASAHTALAETAHQKDSPAFKTRLSQLFDDVRRLKDVYSSLDSK